MAQGLFHWSRLSEIHKEPLVAHYTVASVPVVFHVQAPQVQVDVPCSCGRESFRWRRSISLKCWSCTFHRRRSMSLLRWLCRFLWAVVEETVLSQSQIVVKSARVLDVERCHVRVVSLSTSGTLRRYHAVDGRGRSRACSCRLPVVGDVSAILSVWFHVWPSGGVGYFA